MVEVGKIEFFTDGQIILNDEFPVNPKHVMQSTGLLDKDGVEIFEGDIIQFKSYWVNKRWWSDLKDIPVIDEECKKQREDITISKHQVVFRDGGFYLGYSVSFKDVARGERHKTGRSHWCDTEEKQWDFEVIGNIYQSPELILEAKGTV
jgi:uncharacterized phage protein (TIGR01671 family)